MRNYREPTCANFLKEPFILGVRLLPLLLLLAVVGALQVIGVTYVAAGVAVLGYGALRLQVKFGKNGSEEALLFFLEKRLGKPNQPITEQLSFEFKHSDTLDEEDAIFHKSQIEEALRIEAHKSALIKIRISDAGAELVR